MKTLFRDHYIIDGSMKRARRADLLVVDHKITAIADAFTLPLEANTIDGKGENLLIPSFFNAHCHSPMGLIRGLAEEMPLMPWLEQKVWPLEAKLTADDIYTGAQLGILEMVKNGITGFADMYMQMHSVSRAVNELGVYGAIAVGVSSRTPELLHESLTKDYRPYEGKRIRTILDPHAPYTVSFEGMQAIAQKAIDENMPLSVHFLEAQWERDYLKKTFGLTPIEYLTQTRLCDVKHLVLAHGVWLTDEEIDFCVEKNISVVHCPASNLKLASGFAPLPTMYKKGLRVALGTDGAASNNRLDIFSEIRLAALMHKAKAEDPTVATAQQLLLSATYEGAKAFGFEDKGLLREGFDADLSVINLKAPHYLGADEDSLLGFLVYAGTAQDIYGVMSAGKWLLYHREFISAMEGNILKDAAAVRQRLLSA